MSLETLQKKLIQINNILKFDLNMPPLKTTICEYNEWPKIVKELIELNTKTVTKIKAVYMAWCVYYFVASIEFKQHDNFEKILYKKLEEFEQDGLYLGYLIGVNQKEKTFPYEFLEKFIKIELLIFSLRISENLLVPILKELNVKVKINTFKNGNFVISIDSQKVPLNIFNILFNYNLVTDNMVLNVIFDASLNMLEVSNNSLTLTTSNPHVVDYMLKIFDKNKIQDFSSVFNCRNRSISVLKLYNRSGDFTGCKINSLSNTNLSQLDVARVLPEEFDLEFFTCDNPYVTLKKIIPLITHEVLDSSIYTYISNFIPKDEIGDEIEDEEEDEIEYEEEDDFQDEILIS